MKLKAKDQTNKDDINILVETSESTNTHSSHLDKKVKILDIMMDEDIIKLYIIKASESEILNSAKKLDFKTKRLCFI